MHVLYGSAAGVTGAGSDLLRQVEHGVVGEPVRFEFFGYAFGAGGGTAEVSGADGLRDAPRHHSAVAQ